MNRSWKCWLLLLSVALILFGDTKNGQAADRSHVWLVTPEEASLPPEAPEEHLTPGGLSDISREMSELGPSIEVLKPVSGAPMSSPTEIAIRCTPKQDPIDWKTLHVWLVKFINIDITERVRPFVTSSGIDIPAAQLPSGHHTVRISLADITGGLTVKQATLIVE